MRNDTEIKSRDGLEGLAAFGTGDFERAVERFETALEAAFDPGEIKALLLRLSDAYDHLQRYDRSLDALRRALDLDPDNAAVWNNIGVVCRRIDREDEAREAFERALQHEPNNATVLVNLGACALRNGDIGTAKANLDKALSLAPGNPQAHANLALTLALFGRIEEAEEELQLAAFYGFDGVAPIQDRIDGLKKIRQEILSRTDEADVKQPGDEGAEKEEPT